jgi:tRNA A37 methylthiotransferase MiaB
VAAELDAGIAPDRAQERLEIFQELQRGLTLAAHRARVGAETEVLVEGESRRGGQLQGRDPYHRVINLAGDATGAGIAAGDLVTADIVEATPHSLIGVVRFARSVKERGRIADEGKRETALA